VETYSRTRVRGHIFVQLDKSKRNLQECQTQILTGRTLPVYDGHDKKQHYMERQRYCDCLDC
jgi:hypothetical protein